EGAGTAYEERVRRDGNCRKSRPRLLVDVLRAPARRRATAGCRDAKGAYSADTELGELGPDSSGHTARAGRDRREVSHWRHFECGWEDRGRVVSLRNLR